MDSFWRQRSTAVFFLVAFGAAWIGWSFYQALDLDRSTVLGETLFVSGWFCSLGGFAAWLVARGRAGVRDLARRCVLWRVPLVWWLVALLLPMAYQIAAFSLYGAFSGGVGTVRPSAIAHYGSGPGLALVLTGPLGEEAGWRGFLLPRMLERWSALHSSLVVGLIWAVWHVPVFLENEFSTVHGTVLFSLTIVCYSVVMTVVFLHTRASVLVAVVLHWTFNVSYYLAAPRLFPDVDVGGLAFNYVRLAVFAATSALLVVVTGARAFARRPATAATTASGAELDAAGGAGAAQRFQG
jgi:membrane protease YdiL (CAAX protease family)